MAVTRMPQSTTKFVILPNSLLGLMLRIYKSPPRLSLRASRSPFGGAQNLWQISHCTEDSVIRRYIHRQSQSISLHTDLMAALRTVLLAVRKGDLWRAQIVC